jgi:plasmid stabilization system protein ParE
MSHVRLSRRAQSDVVRLHAFLSEKDIVAAKRAVNVICDSFGPLRTTPLMGRPVEESDNLRELVIEFGASGYLALYRFEPTLDAVTILAIKHQSEDDYQ